MYQVGAWLDLFRTKAGDTGAPSRAVVPKAVIYLGLTSLFTDISSEMVGSVLPVYLVGFLRMSPVQFGLVDGLYQGVAGLVQLVSAGITDRFTRYKEVAAFGYGTSLLCRIGLLATNGAAGITGFLTLDRLGKGMRSAPRDALISLSVQREHLGLAFGVHRAMDAVGAMIGPIIAFIVLRYVVDGYDVVFVVSLCAAVLGFAVLVLLVENRPVESRSSNVRKELVAVVLATPSFRHLALSALLLGGLTISDNFIYLVLQRRTELSAGSFPLLYVLTSACYLLFAVPVGRLADRLGRFPVFLAGHALLIALYAGLISMAPGVTLIISSLVALGLYYSATEGVLMALGSAVLPEQLRTSGLALLTTALAIARFGASAVFGACWTRFGLQPTVLGFLGALALAIIVLAITRPSEVTV